MRERLIAALAKPDTKVLAKVIGKLTVDSQLQATAIITLIDRCGALEKGVAELEARVQQILAGRS